jgi:acetyl esterase/lipase
MAHMFALGYAGGRSLRDVSPSSVSLEGFPPLHVEVGDNECLHDQIKAFIVRAEAEGVKVDYPPAGNPGMGHGAFLCCNMAPHIIYARRQKTVSWAAVLPDSLTKPGCCRGRAQSFRSSKCLRHPSPSPRV